MAGGEEKKEEKKLSLGRSIMLYLHDLVYLLSAIIIIFLILFRVIVVSGSSMNNTLIDGDYLLLVSNLFCAEPEYGDIIVASKESFDDGAPIIKRVIAKEGQVVDINFQQGIVYVDGVALEEDYTLTPTTTPEGVSFPLIVDKDCIFVMGDNRNGSRDSRDPQIGLIDNREVLGKAIVLILPGIDESTNSRDFGRIGALYD